LGLFVFRRYVFRLSALAALTALASACVSPPAPIPADQVLKAPTDAPALRGVLVGGGDRDGLRGHLSAE
jgi:hypothetical protein